jgi:hypothetical protein
MLWIEKSDDDNLRWCWLRAVEWGRWPLFISQSLLPLMLFVCSWKIAILIVLTCNLAWRFVVNSHFISVFLAFIGPLIVRLKWLVCPLCGYYFYSHGNKASAFIALSWPILMTVGMRIIPPSLPMIPAVQTGMIQKMFMGALGYRQALEFQLNRTSESGSVR